VQEAVEGNSRGGALPQVRRSSAATRCYLVNVSVVCAAQVWSTGFVGLSRKAAMI
jgi:hypothetical protein